MAFSLFFYLRCGDNDGTCSTGLLLWLNEEQHAYLHVCHKVTFSNVWPWISQGGLWALTNTMVNNNSENKKGPLLESLQAPPGSRATLNPAKPRQLASCLVQADHFLHLLLWLSVLFPFLLGLLFPTEPPLTLTLGCASPCTRSFLFWSKPQN